MWPANMSLELTPSVGALHCFMPSVGIRSSIESFWERSSPQRAWDFAARSRSAAGIDWILWLNDCHLIRSK